MKRHALPTWSEQEIREAVDGGQIYAWAATDAAKARAVNVVKAEGIYVYDHSGKRYVDWCSGAMCSNFGHTMPESVK